jgi:hypothetical protein
LLTNELLNAVAIHLNEIGVRSLNGPRAKPPRDLTTPAPSSFDKTAISHSPYQAHLMRI